MTLRAKEMSGLQGVVKIMAMPNKRYKASVLTNQCLGKAKEINAEPPGRGTDESFLTDSDEFIVER